MMATEVTRKKSTSLRSPTRIFQVVMMIATFEYLYGTSIATDDDLVTILELVSHSHPHLISNDMWLDPSKGEIIEGDIILPKNINYRTSPNQRNHRHQKLKTSITPTNFTLRDSNIPCCTGDKKFNKYKRHRHSNKRRRKRRRRKQRAATARKERLWENGIIPYEIESEFSGEHRTLFKQAMRYWENSTCLQFVERKPEHKNYIIFTRRSCGCCSFVGMRGNGGQAISIGKNCEKFGIVVHELGHVVGFWHEHTRPDRDKHVQIINKNIVSGQEYNFNKLTREEVDSLGLSYDYESIMHYARNTFAKSNELDTILPKGYVFARPSIGQRMRLSKGDIAQTNKLYNCPKCGRTMLEPTGEIVSPLNSLSDVMLCEWRITSTHGERVFLNITLMNIFSTPYCDADYVEIRDGPVTTSPLLGRYCGSSISGKSLMSTGHQMLITYKTSPGKSVYTGFRATYEALCGGALNINEGVLQSPNYPDDYAPNKECIWTITVGEKYQIALVFQAFEIELHDNCAYDYLEIRDGPSLISPLLARVCGDKIPDDVKSSSNAMLVRFVSDSSVQKMGFSANFVKETDECDNLLHGCQHTCINTVGGYKCQCHIGYELHSDEKSCETACGGVLSSLNGYIRSPSFPDLYPSNKRCVWEIVAPKSFTITLDFTHFDLEGTNQECEYDSVEVFSIMEDGGEKKHGTFCGSRLPPLVTSEGKSLRVTFTSDNSVQKSGFAAVYSTDKDECAINNGGCEHICKNTVGSYVCSCNNGYVLHPNGHGCKEGNCVHYIGSTSGMITSPNYPNAYPSRKECMWYLKTKVGHRVKIVFEDFEMESHQDCEYDNVVVYDGDSINSPMLGRYCGIKPPYPVVSTTNAMTMSFQSDPSVQKKGFRASHFTVCGGRLTATPASKKLYSHVKFGDQNYGNRMDCNWFISSLNGNKIKIELESFELENESHCNYDYLTVIDGFEGAPVVGKFCGTQAPSEIISSGSRMLIRFFSDDTINRKGFVMHFTEI